MKLEVPVRHPTGATKGTIEYAGVDLGENAQLDLGWLACRSHLKSWDSMLTHLSRLRAKVYHRYSQRNANSARIRKKSSNMFDIRYQIHIHIGFWELYSFAPGKEPYLNEQLSWESHDPTSDSVVPLSTSPHQEPTSSGELNRHIKESIFFSFYRLFLVAPISVVFTAVFCSTLFQQGEWDLGTSTWTFLLTNVFPPETHETMMECWWLSSLCSNYSSRNWETNHGMSLGAQRFHLWSTFGSHLHWWHNFGELKWYSESSESAQEAPPPQRGMHSFP